MTVAQQLKNKHKRARKQKKIDFLILVMFVIVSTLFANLFISTWDKEIESQAQYNREYNQIMEERRAE